MHCLACQEHFGTLLEDAGLAPADVRQHVATCADCGTAFAEFRDAVRQLRDLPLVSPPPQLLGQISRALDAEPVRGQRGIVWWQPVTAGLSMAACALVLVWAVVLNPVNSGLDTYSSQLTYNTQTTMAAPGPVAPTASGAPAVSARPLPAPGGRMRPAPRFVGRTMGIAARRQAASQPPSFGAWGERLAQLPATPTAPTASSIDPATGKPRGTFDGGSVPTPAEPLHRQAGEVQLAFAPPVEKTVGLPVVGEVTVTGQAEAMVSLRVATEPGLRVTNAHDGLVYEGPMRHGETLRVPVRMLAWQAGTHRLRLQLNGDVAGVAADVEIVIPGFAGELGKNGEALVSLTFQETPSRRAIRELAAAAGARVVIHEDVERKLVTLDFSAGVPFAAALRILCDDCGYRIEERNEVYHILR